MKRPIDKRFRQAVLDGVKTTTIRKTPWPVGVPITLYSWAGKPYCSEHEDLCVIVVRNVFQIGIVHWPHGIEYSVLMDRNPRHALWKTEGFDSQLEMDDWFKATVKRGEVGHFWLMEFEVVK